MLRSFILRKAHYVTFGDIIKVNYALFKGNGWATSDSSLIEDVATDNDNTIKDYEKILTPEKNSKRHVQDVISKDAL